MTPYTQDTSDRCLTSMKKSGRLALALGGILLGVLLLLMGNGRLFGKESETAEGGTPPVGTVARTTEEYRRDLESRMRALCAQVSGVGAVDVVVTLEGGYEYVYATDKKTTVGGESTSYITVGSGDSENLVYITERAPAIVGIGVVCTGGMDATVRREVTALLTAAFGVGSHQVYVTGKG